MKLFKKLALLVTTLVISLGAGIIAACDDETTSSSSSSDSSVESVEPAPAEYVYKIRVQSVGGFGLRNVNVSLYSGETLVASKNTSAQGDAYFLATDVAQTGVYDVRFSNIPAGWNMDDTVKYQTSEIEGTQLTLSLNPELISTPAPTGTTYRLGDVMHDFEIVTSDNETYKLSTVLQEKKMVLLNFWYNGCGPCAQEFPAMQSAYEERKNEVSILAVSIYDNQESVADYKKENGLTFPMASNKAGLHSLFGVSAVPVSIVIDRYGVISYWHLGYMSAKSDFTGLFDKFVGDDYVQTVIGEDDYDGSGNDGTEEEERVKPNVSAPVFADVDSVLDPNGLVVADAYQWDEDEYSWPFTVQSDANGNKYLRASNADVHNSYSIIHFNIEVAANTALLFDALVSTEKYDKLYVFVDDTLIHGISAETPDLSPWKTYVAYVFEDDQAGTHKISFSYVKDSSKSGGEDEVWLKNLQIKAQSELNTAAYDVNIFRNAATGYNDPTTAEGAAALSQYQNYITPVLNEEDGYFHVNAANGPLLMAGIMDPVLWNTYDLWQLAAADYLIYDGINLKAAVEDFAWVANQITLTSANGYVPVTEELRKLLELLTKIQGVYGETSDKPNHPNEWLELCVYYDHYGATPVMDDPARGVTYEAAIPLKEGENEIDCFISMTPIGVKHKFTPDKSGVYRFHSVVDKEYEDTSASTNPVAWIVDSDKETFLAYCEDTLLLYNENRTQIDDDGNVENFDIYVYMEKDVTYYALFAFFLNATGKFPMHVDYVGETHTYLTNCCVEPFSFNLVTNETYQPGIVPYELGDDGYYYVVDEDGNQTSKIYLDMVHATYLFPSDSLENVINSADKYGVTKRLFYLDGVDYTQTMAQYLRQAGFNNNELHGLVAVDEQLMQILVKLMQKSDGFGGIKNSWQRMCYYYRTVSAE